MMNMFNDYAKYYDFLYQDKDYNGEVDYIDQLIKKYHPISKSIFELGSGTGKHAILLAQKGFNVTGIDLSEKMVGIANQRVKNQKLNIEFFCNDIRYAKLDKNFDVAISLFHVFSYQITNDDLISAINTAATHLNKDGLLIFDCWYGPAVLINQPTVKVKRVENQDYLVTRISEPQIFLNENLVSVDFQVFIEDKKTGQIQKLKETHNMRYLFKPELEFMLNQCGFKIEKIETWVSGDVPDKNCWGACFVCRKVQ